MSEYFSNPNKKDIRILLRRLVDKYHDPSFIEGDPISIPHEYTLLQDIEITGFWTAMLAWGQRKTIINKSRALFDLMDRAPYDFILHHEEKDRARFEGFKHRTFQYTDTLYFLEFLQWYYKQNKSLEHAFSQHINASAPSIKDALSGFYNLFFHLDTAPRRTRKHIASPVKGSTCKRLNMFLRWMVRQDDKGVDFGLWRSISPAWLMIPLDVHVERTARKLGIIRLKTRNWATVEEITAFCKTVFPEDPALCDYALFGASVLEHK